MDHEEQEQHKEHIASNYDRLSAAYAAALYDELSRKPLDRLLLRDFHERTDGTGLIADVGCGPGEVADFLYQLGATQILGIDISEKMIEEARRLNPAIDFRVGDMSRFNLPDACLAGISAFYAIVNYRLAELPNIFSEFSRVLQAEGLLLLTFHVGNEVVEPGELFGEKTSLSFTLFEIESVRPLLEEAGLHPIYALVREPHISVEAETKRAYILAVKRS